MRSTRLAGAIASFAAAGLVLAGCDMNGEEDAATGDDAPADTDNGMGNGADEETDDEAAPTDEFGPACDAVPEDGDGSFEGMADDPVGTAASNNPALSTLTDAVMEADLVDTLNGAEDITVFAPANDAFDEIPEEDLNALLQDQEQLTEVLTFHVVEGQYDANDLQAGEFDSLQGDTVQTEGSGEDYTVEGEANVVCGNVQTGNATVHIIDGVLMPAEE